MPVVNQWKAKGKEDAAAKNAPATAAAEPAPAETSGRRVGRFRSMKDQPPKEEPPAEDPPATNVSRSKSVADKWSAASQDDQKVNAGRIQLRSVSSTQK